MLRLAQTLRRRPSQFRAICTSMRAVVGNHPIRLDLTSPTIIGAATSRGTRMYQEDHYTVGVIHVPPLELQEGIKHTAGADWDISRLPTELASQVLYAAIYDGHGGADVSQYLHDNLHELMESVNRDSIPPVLEWIQTLGGYFKRFRGGALAPWLEDPSADVPFDLDIRATLAFLQADKNIAELIPESGNMGSTASVVMLHPLDIPPIGFPLAKRVSVNVAHCGDTRVLLCATAGGQVEALTERHHADARGEASRLRRLGYGVVTDSFGEARWMGAVENTRGLGDGHFKRFGVTAEPEMTTRVLHTPDWAFIVLTTDGISSILSDQEVVDLARYAKLPSKAANDIVSFAEELGTQDNATAVVIPLAGWGKVTGPDKTKDLRVYRQNQAVGSERQRRM